MKKLILALTLVLLLPLSAWCLDVVPGLKGFGTDTRAAYGDSGDPVICVVDTIAHRSGSLSGATDGNAPTGAETRNGVSVAVGSFLECINYVPPTNSGKVIIFEVSGTINAEAADVEYRVDNSYTTIAGQTAPSPGITLRNIRFTVRTASNVLVQHIRSRIGDGSPGYDPELNRAIFVTSKYGTTNNVVIDHVSASWGIDTCFTVYQDQGGTTTNVTVSNSIISEGLWHSLHSEGKHSKGLALQIGTDNISAINNIIMSSVDRNPYIRWGGKVIVNNYTYNFGDNCLTFSPVFSSIDSAAVGNFCDPGPSSAEGGTGIYHSVLNTDIEEWLENFDNSSLYFLDNTWDTVSQTNSSDWTKVWDKGSYGTSTFKVTGGTPSTDAPLWPTGLTPIAATAVKAYVTANAGARPADRDEVDARLITEIGAGEGALVDSPSDVGGWPVLAVNSSAHTDLPASPHADDDSDGYTNLEEFLHDFAKIVEGDSVNAQGQIPADNATGVNITASASAYLSPLIDSVDIWVDPGACDGTPDGAADSDDDADGIYDMSTLIVNTAYCLTYMANYEGTTGDYTQSDFTTTSGPSGEPPDPSNSLVGKWNVGGVDVKWNVGGVDGK